MRATGEISRELAALSQEQAALSGRLTALATEVALGGLGVESQQAAAAPPDPLLTVPQCAAELGFREAYVYGIIREGKLSAVRPPGVGRNGRPTSGKYVRVRRSALEAFKARFERRAAGNKMLPSGHETYNSLSDRTDTAAASRY